MRFLLVSEDALLKAIEQEIRDCFDWSPGEDRADLEAARIASDALLRLTPDQIAILEGVNPTGPMCPARHHGHPSPKPSPSPR